MSSYRWTNKNGTITITIPEYVFDSLPATGPDGSYLEYAMRFKSLKRQLDAIPAHRLVHELRQLGVWTRRELKDLEQNKVRLLRSVFYDLMEAVK